jgi:hypothetical protein
VLSKGAAMDQRPRAKPIKQQRFHWRWPPIFAKFIVEFAKGNECISRVTRNINDLAVRGT